MLSDKEQGQEIDTVGCWMIGMSGMITILCNLHRQVLNSPFGTIDKRQIGNVSLGPFPIRYYGALLTS